MMETPEDTKEQNTMSENTSPKETLFQHTRKTAITLTLFAVIFTALMSFVFGITKDPIEKSEAAARKALFSQIVPATLYDNNVIEDTLIIPAAPLLGLNEQSRVHRARMQGQVVAVILEAIAHDGYSGDIKLLIAIHKNGVISGVRVVAHKETPGLGDYIDVAKSSWIKIFDGQSLDKTPKDSWKVKKDGGQFDYVVGATITPRAVIKSVEKALEYFNLHQQQLLGAEEVETKDDNEPV